MKYRAASLLPADPELTSDLEWMLQSGQVPEDALAAELTRAYFQDLARWLALVLDDPDGAAVASLEAILAAAAQAYRFPGGCSAREWVFQQAARAARGELRQLRRKRLLSGLAALFGRQGMGISQPETGLQAAAWLATDQLPDEPRLAACLAWGLGETPESIGTILGKAETDVDGLLELARRRVLLNLPLFDLSRQDLPEQDLDQTVQAIFEARYRQLWPEPPEIESLVEAVAAEAGRQTGLRSRLLRFKEFAWLGVVAALVLGGFYLVNQLLPEQLPPGAASGPGQSASPDQTGLSPDRVLRLDYYAQPGETVDEIGQALELPQAEIERLRDTFANGHLDLASPLRIGLVAPEQFPRPTPVAPVAHRQAPLTINSSPLEIRNLINLSPTLWKTLWLDAVIFDYGPDGYVGSPHQYRVQSWYSQPDKSLTVVWTSGSDNTHAVLRKNGVRYSSYQQQGWLEARQDGAERWDQNLTGDMVFPNRSQIFGRPGQVRVVGEDLVAGRPTIVVDWRTEGDSVWPNRYRMWVDVQTGMILRFQFYSGLDGDSLLGEVIFARLALDVDFPQADLFTPWRLQDQVFVSDYRGELADASVIPRQTLTASEAQRDQDRQPPPAGLDLSASRLSFQYELTLKPSTKPSNVAVFADQYYLGEVQLADPWSVYCFRSPDGSKVAYSLILTAGL